MENRRGRAKRPPATIIAGRPAARTVRLPVRLPSQWANLGPRSSFP
jgi:hypothetical protein